MKLKMLNYTLTNMYKPMNDSSDYTKSKKRDLLVSLATIVITLAAGCQVANPISNDNLRISKSKQALLEKYIAESETPYIHRSGGLYHRRVGFMSQKPIFEIGPVPFYIHVLEEDSQYPPYEEKSTISIESVLHF